MVHLFCFIPKKEDQLNFELKLYIGPLILDCLGVMGNKLESKLLKFLKNKTIQMFKFDVLAQQRLLFVCFFFFFGKKGSSVYILLFFKTGQKSRKERYRNNEVIKSICRSLHPFRPRGSRIIS